MKLKQIAILTSALIGCTVSIAATTPPPETKAEAAINKLVKKQLTAVDTFHAAGNLEGFVMKPAQGGMPVLMYADKAGEYVLYGEVFDSEGKSLSKEYTAKYVQPYVANMLEANLGKSHSFAQGSADAKAQMYVVADPNCSACHYFYDAVKPLVDDGTLQVHWILVTFLKSDSPNKAAAILAAKDPSLSMDKNESNFDNAHEEGGIASLDPIPEDLQKQLDDNMGFFTDSGLSKTPTLIFYSNDELQIIEGMPRDMAGFLKKVKPTVHKAAKADK